MVGSLLNNNLASIYMKFSLPDCSNIQIFGCKTRYVPAEVRKQNLLNAFQIYYSLCYAPRYI